MLKGLGSFVVRTLLLSLLSTPAWAESTLYINSQAGDTVGGGQSVTYTDSDGTFGAAPKSTNGVTLTFTGLTQASSWTLTFAAPTAGTLAVGNYDNAQYPAISPLRPNIYVSALSTGCEYGTNGRFIVRAITTDGSGNITSFAADFVQTCGNDTGNLTGAIRFNSSIPVAVDEPTADAGANQLVQQGATVQLDGSLSLPGNGSVTAYTWTQLSGPSVSLSDATIVNPTFIAPDVALGGADVVLQLEVDNSLALSSLSTVTIHVANPGDPLTIFTDSVDPGAFISATPASLNSLQAQFTTSKLTFGGDGVTVGANGGLNNSLAASFAAPIGQTLQVGTYDGAQRYPFQAEGLPGLDFGSCNTSNGRFTVLDLQKDGNGNVTSFAADFDQHCEGQVPAAHGKVRFNSTVPLDAPVADIAPVETMVQGETVTLSAGSWSTGTDGDDISSYQWTQVSGPSVSLSDPSAADPTFTAPSVTPGGADLVFQLTVTNSLGISSSTTVTVHVANPADTSTLLHVEVTPGAGQDDGLSYTVTPTQLSFVPSMSPNSMTMRIGGYAFNSLVVTMATPVNSPQALQAGTYDNALLPLGLFPSLGFSGSGSLGCSTGTATGRFVILAIQTDSNGNLTSLAADFDEYCSSNGTSLHGVLRYNSTVPQDAPEADAGGKQQATPGATVSMPAITSYAGGDGATIASYQWTQLSGPNVTLSDNGAATPTFTAPDVPVGGADLVFQLTVTNSNGLTDTDQATVHVYNPADPRNLLHITTDAGDPIGKGQTFDYNELNALFGAQTPGYPYQGTTAMLVKVTYNQGQLPQSGQWTMEFAPYLNHVLQTGPYDQAMNPYLFGSIAPQPGLAVADGYQSCFELTGYFDILDIQTDQYGNITSLAADFVQTCSGASGSLHGQLRYNSAVPLNVPYADAGTGQIADPSSTVTLGGSGSDAGADGATITGYQWTQLSGPDVTLSDPGAANPTFTSPDVPLGGADLVFQLTVTNSNGVTSTSTVTVHVESPDDPKTRFYAVSDPNDPVGGGQTYDFRTTNAVFSVSSAASNGVANNSVTITANNGAPDYDYWRLIVTAPAGQALKVGTRYVLNPNLGLAAPQPSFSASPGYANLDFEGGFFVIRDLRTDSNGNITSFAADFVQCSDDTGPGCAALVGWVRYNSTVPVGIPLADGGSEQKTYSGFPVTLDGSNSRSAPGVSPTYSWNQVVASGDPAVTLSDTTAVKPVFLAPDVPLGGRTLQFKLTVTGSNGLSDTSTVAVAIGNEADPKSVFYFESDPGDPLGGGASGLIVSGSAGNGGNGDVYVSPYSTPAYAQIGVYGNNVGGSGWSIDFAPPFYPAMLTPGMIYSSVNGVNPYFSISSYGVTCDNPTSTFIVRDVSTDSKGYISSLGVDFDIQCEGATGTMRAALRYNSKTPILINEPTAAPGPDMTVTRAGNVTLDGSTSFPGWGNIVSYQWKQVGGQRVTLSNANSAQASFTVTQRMLEGAGTNLKFQLMVKNSLGLTSSGAVAVHAALPTSNLVSLWSDAGDPVGKGGYVYVRPPDGGIQAKVLARDGLGIKLLDGSGWTFDFAVPAGQKLQVGTYSNAVLYNGVAKRLPALYAGTKPGQCKAVSGSFTVLDVVYARNGMPDVLAVNFDQHCNGIGPALHGEIRYHSTLP